MSTSQDASADPARTVRENPTKDVRLKEINPAAAAVVTPQGGHERKNEFRAPWKQQTWKSPNTVRVTLPLGTSQFNAPSFVRKGDPSKTTFDGKPASPHYIKALGYAMNKALRHSEILPTSSTAFAWSTDLCWTLWQDPTTYPNLGRRPTLAELCLAVEYTKG